MTGTSVSVIIPAYRAAHTIGRALDSVFGQSRQPDQVIVVDDGSPDDMAGATRPYGERVTFIRKPNGGAASARNLGLDLANGDFIAFLDADDYWESNKLELQLNKFRSHPELGLVSARWFDQYPGKAPVAQPIDSHPYFDRIIASTGGTAFTVATKIWTSTIVVRREVISRDRFTSGLEPAEDRDLWVRLVSRAPVYITSEPLATYVQDPGSLIRGNVDRDYGNMLRVIHRHSSLLGARGVRQWEAELYRRWAARYLAGGKPRAALWPAWKRFVKDPFSPEAWWILSKSCLCSCRK